MRALLFSVLGLAAILCLVFQARTGSEAVHALDADDVLSHVAAAEGSIDPIHALVKPRYPEAPATRTSVTTPEPMAEVQEDAGVASFTLRVVAPGGSPIAGIAVISNGMHGLELLDSKPLETGSDGRVRVQAQVEDIGGRTDQTKTQSQVAFWAQPGPELDFVRPTRVIVAANEEAVLVLELASSLEVELGSFDDGRKIVAIPPSYSLGGVRNQVPGSGHPNVQLQLLHSDGTTVSGDLARATGVNSVRWDGLPGGTYDLVARLPVPRPTSPLATLKELSVPPGGFCQDPRLIGWNPYDGHELMHLTVLDQNGHPPEYLKVSFRMGESSRGYQSLYDGLPVVLPVMPASHGSGPSDAVKVAVSAPGSVVLVVPITPGVKTVRLTAAMQVTLRFKDAPEGLPDGMKLWVRSASGPAKRASLEATGELETPNGTFEFDATAPGHFIGRAYSPDQKSYNTGNKSLVEPFEFDVVLPDPPGGQQLIDIQLELPSVK